MQRHGAFATAVLAWHRQQQAACCARRGRALAHQQRCWCACRRRCREGRDGGRQGRRGTFQPWGGRQPTPGAGGRPQGCCGLNARAAASDLLVEAGRYFSRYVSFQEQRSACLSPLLPPLSPSLRRLCAAFSRASDFDALAASSFHPTPLLCTFSLQTKVPQPKTIVLSQHIEAKWTPLPLFYYL